MRREYLFFTVLAIVILVLAFYVTVEGQDEAINNAKELKIGANDVGEGWEESFSYMDDPAKALEEFYKKTGEIEFEISELKKNSVKDGYLLILKRTKSPKSLVEVDVFVFENTNGTKKFFDFMKNETAGEFSHFMKNKNASISGIGDDAAFYSSGSTHIWVVRASNAFIRVITWDGKDTGREVTELIVEKAKR